MKSVLLNLALVFWLIGLTTACTKNSDSPNNLDAVGASIHQMLSDADETLSPSGQITARAPLKDWLERGWELLIPSAYAASCWSIGFTCNGSTGVATRDFGSGCTLGFGGLTRTGTVSVTLAKADTSGTCSRAQAATTVRKPNFAITSRSGAQLAVTSAGVTAYDTTVTFGEGQKLTHQGGENYTWETFGVNRKLTSGATTLYDISTRTGTPLSIVGTAREGRRITGGTLQIFHNVAEYTSSLTFEDIEYSASCNEPVAGTLHGELTGSLAGTLTVTFNGCGSSTLSFQQADKDAISVDVESDGSTTET